MAAIAAIFATSFVVSLSGALMPGPLFTLTVRETLRSGFWVGPVVTLGHGLIELVLVIALAIGLKEVLGEEGPATAAIAFFGGLFLLWMGYQMVRTAPRAHLELEPSGRDHGAKPFRQNPTGAPGGYRGSLLAAVAGTGSTTAARGLAPMAAVLVPAGVIVSVSNPYWVIWWASIGTAYISESLDAGGLGVTSFFTAHILSDLVWLSLVAFVLATGRRLMSQRVYQSILVLCGLFLLMLAAWFIYSGVDFLR
jgi:threonine/homoserine/homoserine lactone efflux protein